MINYIDWGRMSYKEAWEKQTTLFQEKIDSKLTGGLPSCDFILVEHNPVYTLGKHGNEANMLLTPERLQAVGAELFHIDRGGDITYHGPGQITGYPIFDLEQLGLGLKAYIHTIEEMIIRVLAHYGIEGFRIEGATGVWVNTISSELQNRNVFDVQMFKCSNVQLKKVCAIGVRASRYVTMHGFALNVNTDLRYFSYINPCGFTDKGVTSLQELLQREVPLEEVKQILFQEALQLFSH